jgi:hypothetical protein
MPIVLPHSVFFRIMKTGSTFVDQAIQRSGLRVCVIARTHDTPAALEKIRHRGVAFGKKRFATVRNPVTWYQSLWSAKQRAGQINELFRIRVLDKDAARIRQNEEQDFCSWLNRLMGDSPGLVSRLYSCYLGQNYDEFDAVLRQENLIEGLIATLQSFGEVFDPENIRQMEPINTAFSDFHDLAKYDMTTLQRLFQVEEKAFLMLHYSRNADDYTVHLKAT